MAYVYRHIRLDKNEPFYIGIGSDPKYARANSKRGRNSIWTKIYSKCKINVEIIFDNLEWEEVIEKEKELIKKYGRINNNTGILANMTDGGDGILGHKHSEETKNKISKSKTGTKLSSDHKALISIRSKNTKIGLKNPFYGKKHTIESLNKMSKSLTGKLSGDKNPMYGKKSPNRKPVINSSTGEIFECCKIAASAYNINSGTLQSKLNGRDKNNTDLMYLENYKK